LALYIETKKPPIASLQLPIASTKGFEAGSGKIHEIMLISRHLNRGIRIDFRNIANH